MLEYNTMSVLGIDYGTKRVGLAIEDTDIDALS